MYINMEVVSNININGLFGFFICNIEVSKGKNLCIYIYI